MKLIIQIPCYNEETTLPVVLSAIPTQIEGVDNIEVLVIDDGSVDNTAAVAEARGAVVVKNFRNLGLARTFRRGVAECLRRGADVIVNIDGDNQYKAQDIPKLIAPILAQKADIVIADRQTDSIPHFSFLKKCLQKLGSWVVRTLSGVSVTDTVSGFRAMTRDAASKINILSNFTYTIEMLLQANSKGLTIAEVAVNTNPKERESRLFSNIWTYITYSIATIIRVFTLYNPLKVFVVFGSAFVLAGFLIGLRFLYFFITVGSAGHVQSLILAAVLLIIGSTIVMFGVLADLIQANRKLLDETLHYLKNLDRRD